MFNQTAGTGKVLFIAMSIDFKSIIYFCSFFLNVYSFIIFFAESALEVLGILNNFSEETYTFN